MSSNLTWLINGNQKQSDATFILHSHYIPSFFRRSFRITSHVCVITLMLTGLNLNQNARADESVDPSASDSHEELIAIEITGSEESSTDQSRPGPQPGAMPASFLTANICGSSRSEYCKGDPLPALVKYIKEHKPTAFALQEVCGCQANELSRMLRKQGLDYVQRYKNLTPGGVALNCEEDAWLGEGIALFHAGDTLGDIQEGIYKELVNIIHWDVKWPRIHGSIKRPRGYVCVKVPQPEFWACATHIEVKPGKAQRSQIEEIAEIAEGLNAPDANGDRIPVVVGGDFNVPPMPMRPLVFRGGLFSIPGLLPFSPLNPMLDGDRYDFGTGELLEFDIPSDRFVRRIKATHGDDKLDYIFHSEDIYVNFSEVFPAVDADYPTDYPDWASDHRFLFNDFYLLP
ncbi:MAG: endonuclease/exonuclease/phosphatase family protein [Candidatus Thiodiazotropha sp.]